MARYRDAIEWIAREDDTDFLDDTETGDEPTLSVTASLVADLFDKTDAEVCADIRAALRRIERTDR